ncbi:MAG TPA: NAD(P)/FAD-dependent oxidoreductase, partial [Vicinamibacterales bacterium]|nr:NAD(P)/FAD-dependent oxidoreductase [Vicinamibacterales bacterium]
RSRALHGYLTRDGIAPAELNEIGRGELTAYGIDFRCTGVTSACRQDDHFRVCLGTGIEEDARYLLIATGVIDDLPAINGFEECYGRSVFHCPYCDGWECRNRRLAAFGRGREVTALALGLRTWSKDVLLTTNGARLQAADRDLLARNGVAVRTEPIRQLQHDDGELSQIVFTRGDAVGRDALFFTTGQHPQSPLAIGLGCALTRRGVVKTGSRSDTNVDRVFVAGDASRDAQFVVVAAAEGVKAAVAINQALQAERIAR